MTDTAVAADRLARGNLHGFLAFRVLFNARFYYPVIAVLFLDLGLTAAEYTLLNFLWALVIVGFEVPSGVLADRVGRRPLIVAAAVLMVLEMVILCLAPQNGGGWLLLFCLVNRVFSGLAEALASGADESLAYDSLVAARREAEWAAWLSRLMAWQSAAMVVAMLVGSAVYDAALVNGVLAMLWPSAWGDVWVLDAATTLRFPLYLNLLTALGVLLIAWRLQEPPRETAATVPTTAETVRGVATAGWWIVCTPAALFVILGGMAIDSVIRLFLTFSSAYFRVIELPDASFGLFGALMAAIGLVVAPLMAPLQRCSLGTQFALLATVTVVGLSGLALAIPLWGAVFALVLAAAFSAVGFFVSTALNRLVTGAQRATVLSFKGLVFNLGYGFVSLLFAEGLRQFHDPSGDTSIEAALGLLPYWFAFTVLLLALGFWRRRRRLTVVTAA